MLLKPEDIIINKGDESKSLYFINSGSLEIFINNPKLGKVDGEYFISESGTVVGEIGVIFDTTRSAYCIARYYTVLSMLQKDRFLLLNQTDSSLKKLLKSQIDRYKDKTTLLLR